MMGVWEEYDTSSVVLGVEYSWGLITYHWSMMTLAFWYAVCTLSTSFSSSLSPLLFLFLFLFYFYFYFYIYLCFILYIYFFVYFLSLFHILQNIFFSRFISFSFSLSLFAFFSFIVSKDKSSYRTLPHSISPISRKANPRKCDGLSKRVP